MFTAKRHGESLSRRQAYLVRSGTGRVIASSGGFAALDVGVSQRDFVKTHRSGHQGSRGLESTIKQTILIGAMALYSCALPRLCLGHDAQMLETVAERSTEALSWPAAFMALSMPTGSTRPANLHFARS